MPSLHRCDKKEYSLCSDLIKPVSDEPEGIGKKGEMSEYKNSPGSTMERYGIPEYLMPLFAG